MIPLPCPCCGDSRPFVNCNGNNEGIYTGWMSSTSLGVQCYTCGLSVKRELPDTRPDCCKTKEDVYEFTFNQALEAWNRRVG